MAALKSALVAALSILLLGIAPALLSPAPASAACVTSTGAPCKTAKQQRAAFKRGDMGRTHVTKSMWSHAFKVKLRKVVRRKGLIPPAGGANRVAARGFRYVDWGQYWDAFNNAIDCVAPGAESSCKKDFDHVKALKRPAKIVVGCGGLAIAAYYTGGEAVPAQTALSGGMTCGWGVAIANW